MQWQIPPANALKLNVDGAIFADKHRVGIGMIMRGEHVSFRFGANLGIREVNELEEIELLAIFRRIQMSASMSVSKLIFDCFLMVELCNKDHPLNSKFGVLSSKIKVLQSRFEVCTI